MFDSLKILGLGYTATYADVKAKYQAMARIIYHPDQHNPERTGLTGIRMSKFCVFHKVLLLPTYLLILRRNLYKMFGLASKKDVDYLQT